MSLRLMAFASLYCGFSVVNGSWPVGKVTPAKPAQENLSEADGNANFRDRLESPKPNAESETLVCFVFK